MFPFYTRASSESIKLMNLHTLDFASTHASMKCLSCDHNNTVGLKYCGKCGTRLSAECAACQQLNPLGQKFCGACGHCLEAAAPTPAIISYTPALLNAGVLASRLAGEGERKHVTVLFCDIVDSTALAGRLGPEAWHEVLNRFFERALAAVHGHGGTLNQFLGDGFMALFGAPIAYEDHAERAAHTALALRRVINGDAMSGTMLEIRIGMNTGGVVVGKIGDNLRMDYTAIGDTTNLAARMQSTAAPGEVRLTKATWQAVRGHFECEALGDQRVKGKTEPVAVYRLLGMHDRPVPQELAVGYSTLVGREHECTVLRACLGRLLCGNGGITGVIGDAGLGKTRLLLELRRDSDDRVYWLQGRVLSFGQTLSYGPFIEVLRGATEIHESDSREACWQKLEEFVTALLGADAARHIPFVGMLIGLDLPTMAARLVKRLEAQDVRGQIFIAARRIFEVLAMRQALVLELDDWQWADEASAALLEHLLALTVTCPLQIFVVGRADQSTACTRFVEHARVHYPERYTELLLAPLSSSNSNQLIENILATKYFPHRLRGLILQEADGNPLFIEEIVRSLQETGMLQRDPISGGLQTIADITTLTLPDTIEGIVSARIDRLEEDVRQVLKLAAVIGRNFHRRILQALDEAEHQLDACLNKLQELELIREKRHLPEIEYMFKNAVVQEASYQSILGDRRRQLHQRVGEAMERLFRDRLDEFASFLAYHFARAEQWAKAQAYLLRAGDQAARMAADYEAIAHYRATLDALSRSVGVQWPRSERAGLERKIGEALFRLGKHDEATDCFLRALGLLDVRYPDSKWAVRGLVALHVLRRAWRYLAGEFRKPSSLTPAKEHYERVQTLESLAWMDYFRNQERFFLDVMVALELAEGREIGPAIIKGYMGLGIVCDVLGFKSLASFHHRRALALAKTTDDLPARASAEFGASMHALYTGQWDEAATRMLEASQIWERLGRLREWGVSLGTLAWLHQQRGEHPRAAFMVEVLKRTADESGDAQLGNIARYLNAVAQMRQGQLEATLPSIVETLAVATAIADYQSLPEYASTLARCAHWMGDERRARQALVEGEKNARAHAAAPDTETALWISAAELALASINDSKQKVPAAIRSELKRTLKALRRLAHRYAPAIPVALGTRAALAWLGGRVARADRLWADAVTAAQNLGAIDHCAAIYYSQGCLTRSAERLNEAAQLYAAIGARFELARCYRQLIDTVRHRDPIEADRLYRLAKELHALMTAEHERQLLEQTWRGGGNGAITQPN